MSLLGTLKSRISLGLWAGLSLLLQSCGQIVLPFAANVAPLALEQLVSTEKNVPKVIVLGALDSGFLTYTLVTEVTHGTLSPLVGNSVIYTPDTNYTGTDSLVFKASDGELESNIAVVSIYVNNPPLAQALTGSTNEDTNLSLAFNGTDVENSPLSYSIATQPAHGSLSSINGANVTYIPAPNYFGADSFTYRAFDGFSFSPAVTVSLTVNSIPDAPISANLAETTIEDTAKTINLSATDADGDSLTYSIVANPTRGTLGTLSGSSILYTPNADFTGSDSFTFRTNDGGLNSNTATVSITVTPANDAPVANSVAVSTPEDTAKQITMTAFDVEGNPLTYSIVTPPTLGTLSVVAGNKVTYTPSANYYGADSFTFRVFDGLSYSAPATVSLTVTSVNDAPVAATQSVSVSVNVPKQITLVADDADADGLLYSIVTSPAHGTLGAMVDGVLTYTPTNLYSGPDSFTFRANDGAANSNTATVSITVQPLTPVVLNVSSSSVSRPDTVNYTISGGAPPYTLRSTRGSLSNYSGSGNFDPLSDTGVATVTVTDAASQTAQQAITITNTEPLKISFQNPVPAGLQRYLHAISSVAGKLYLIGGHDGSRLRNDTKVFDPSAGSGGAWAELSPSGSIPSVRHYHTAVTIAEKIYLFGGHTNSNPVNELNVFDPQVGSQGEWRALSPAGTAPNARYNHTAVALGSKMYVFSGQGSTYFKDLWVYDPAVGSDGTWSKLSPTGSYPIQRVMHSAVALNGKMYVFGGNASLLMNDLRVYDPSIGANGAWSAVNPSGTAPSKRQAHTAAVIGGKMYIFGGNGSTGNLNDLHVYDPSVGAQGSWSALSPAGTIPCQRSYIKSAVINQKMYVFGGSANCIGITSEIQVYDPSVGAQGTWTKPTPVGAATSPSMMLGSTANYFVTGGTEPWNVSTTDGSVSSSTGSGVLTAPMSGSSLILSVTDALAASDSLTVNLLPELVITPAKSTISSNSSMTYTVAGGQAPYSFSTNFGWIDGNNSIFYPSGGSGTANLTVTDANGNSTQAQVEVIYTDLTISTSSWATPGGSVWYSVYGGSGSYTISTNDGWVDNSSGDGNWYVPGGPGIATLTVTDSYGVETSVLLTVTSPLTITMNTNLNYGESTPYTVSGGSGSYGINGYWCSNFDNWSGSGTYTAWCSGTDYFQFYDYNTGEYAEVYVYVTYPDPPVLSVPKTTISVGETLEYTVTGAGNNFYVQDNTGLVGLTNNYGSGSLTPTTGGLIDLYLYDYNTGNSQSIQITVMGALALNISPTAIPVNGTAYYSTQETYGPYTYSVDIGGIDNSSGSGTFTAPATPGVATITVTDGLGNSGQGSVVVTGSSGTWTKINGFSDRTGASMVAISGKIYIFGGRYNDFFNDLSVFDPALGTMKVLAPTGAIPEARENHTATVINNKMYIFSGNTNSGFSSTLHVYDPAIGTDGQWTTLSPAGSAPSPRNVFTAVTINNKMYVFGGQMNGTYYNDLKVYDPSVGAQGTWSTPSAAGSAPSPRHGHHAFVINNKMYIYSGYNGSNYDQMYVYDPSVGAGGTWSLLSPAGTKPEARRHGVMVVDSLTNKAYLFGGYTNGNTNTFHSYDPSVGAGGTWTSITAAGTVPVPRHNGAGVMLSGKFYNYSGNLSGLRENVIDMWDSTVGAQGTWSVLRPAGLAPSRRNVHISELIGTKMYVFGGQISGGYTNGLSSYDLSTNTWKGLVPTGTAPTPRGYVASAVVASKLYIFGGTGSTRFDEVYRYDPSIGTDGQWTLLAPAGSIPFPRYYAGMAVVSGKLYVFGGHSGSFALDDTYVFDPAAGAQGTWTELNPAGPTPPGLHGHRMVTLGSKIYCYGGNRNIDNQNTNDLWVFDPSQGSSGTWTLLSPAGIASAKRMSHSFTTVGSKLFAYGGSGAPDSLVHVYDPSLGVHGTWVAQTATGSTVGYNNHSAISYAGKLHFFGYEGRSDIYIYQPAP
jgi:hypothetical protein